MEDSFMDKDGVITNEPGYYVWWEQQFLGSQKLQVYVNILSAIVNAFHPRTLIFTIYYLSQLPPGIVLEAIVYPLYPFMNLPYIPWDTYFKNLTDKPAA